MAKKVNFAKRKAKGKKKPKRDTALDFPFGALAPKGKRRGGFGGGS
jgi:hypothetical protein